MVNFTGTSGVTGVTVTPGVNFSEVLSLLIQAESSNNYSWCFVIYPTMDITIAYDRAGLLHGGSQSIDIRNWYDVYITNSVFRCGNNAPADFKLEFLRGIIVVK